MKNPSDDSSQENTLQNESRSNSVLRTLISRIREKKAVARGLNDEVRKIYAEAKATGIDKTVLGNVVSFIEKREKDPEAFAERSAIFDRYLAEHDGTVVATHAHADAREGRLAKTAGTAIADPLTPTGK